MIAIISGYIIGELNLEKHIEKWVFQFSGGSEESTNKKIAFGQRITLGFTAVKEILGKVWIYI